MTNAERQRKHRRKLRRAGIVRIPVEVTDVGVSFLQQCFESAWNPGDTLTEFYEKAIIRGAAFIANTGKGQGKCKVPNGALRRNAKSLLS